jgi:AcrR family transcriptional regulator
VPPPGGLSPLHLGLSNCLEYYSRQAPGYAGKIDTQQQAAGAFSGRPAARVSAPSSRRRGPGSTAQGRRSRDRVLRASLDLITEVGIDQVRLAEIARRAGMSSGQVMYYFTTKEHILLETLAWQEHEDTRHRRAVLPEVAGVWRQLERYVGLYLPSGPADPAWILWTEAWARAPHNAEVAGFLDELMRPWDEDLAEIVRRGLAEGTFSLRVAPGDFTTCFCAMLDGLAIVYLNQKPDMARERMMELAMNSARAQLTPAGPPGPA